MAQSLPPRSASLLLLLAGGLGALSLAAQVGRADDLQGIHSAAALANAPRSASGAAVPQSPAPGQALQAAPMQPGFPAAPTVSTPTPTAAPSTPPPPLPTLETASTPELAARDWTLRFIPRIWFVAPSGNVELPSGGAGQQLELNDLNLDNTRIAPLGQIDFRSQKWLVTMSGMHTKVNGLGAAGPGGFQLGNTPVAAGQTFSSSFEYTTLQGGIGYQLFAYNLVDQTYEDKGDTRIRFYAIGGARLHDIQVSIERPGVAGTRSDQSHTAFEVMAAARTEIVIVNNFTIDLDMSISGLDRSSTFDISVAFGYRPIENISAQIGYRNFHTKITSDSGPGEFRYKGSLAGLFAGVTIEF